MLDERDYAPRNGGVVEVEDCTRNRPEELQRPPLEHAVESRSRRADNAQRAHRNHNRYLYRCVRSVGQDDIRKPGHHEQWPAYDASDRPPSQSTTKNSDHRSSARPRAAWGDRVIVNAQRGKEEDPEHEGEKRFARPWSEPSGECFANDKDGDERNVELDLVTERVPRNVGKISR